MIEFRKYNNVAGIYKFENKINHKCYIGLSIDLGSRLRHHINNFNHRRYDTPLYKAFDKYGVDAFDVEILYKVENSIHDIKLLLDQLEVGYIEKYNSYGSTGYNQTRGADAGILGYKFTEEQRKRTSENSKMSAKKYTKRVYLYNIETEWTISFPSIMSASKWLKCNHSQVTRVCNWKQLTINKYWIGSFDERLLKERAEFVKSYSPNYGNSAMKNRKHPVPGLKRHFNTSDGKKIIPQEQREKIRAATYKYIIEVYDGETLVKTYSTSKELNDDMFKLKDPGCVINNIRNYTKHGWKYRGIYTFKLIDKRQIKQ